MKPPGVYQPLPSIKETQYSMLPYTSGAHAERVQPLPSMKEATYSMRPYTGGAQRGEAHLSISRAFILGVFLLSAQIAPAHTAMNYNASMLKQTATGVQNAETMLWNGLRFNASEVGRMTFESTLPLTFNTSFETTQFHHLDNVTMQGTIPLESSWKINADHIEQFGITKQNRSKHFTTFFC